MAKVVPFSKYEAAILLDYHLNVEAQSMTRASAVKKCSDVLRQMARNQGVQIDDKYRSVSGISYQMSAMESAYTGTSGAIPATKLFSEITALYRRDRQLYQELLKEAYHMTEGKQSSSSFKGWLSQQVSSSQFSEYNSVFQEIEKFARKSKIISTSLLESLDAQTVKKIRVSIEHNRFFRITHKRQLEKIYSLLGFILQYVTNQEANTGATANESGDDVSISIPAESPEHVSEPSTGESEGAGSCPPIIRLDSKEDAVLSVLSAHYPYGFNINSPIELVRFRGFYEADHGIECNFDESELITRIKEQGFEFDGKVYIVNIEVQEQLSNIIISAIDNGSVLFYFQAIYSAYENWFFENHVISPEMLKELLTSLFPSFRYRGSYFSTDGVSKNELALLQNEICRVWGDTTVRTFSELDNALPFIPLDKIKHGLSNCDLFVWNTFETYVRRDYFRINVDQIQTIKQAIEQGCDSNGSISFDELPLEDIIAENYELSESAIIEILFGYFSDSYERNQKIIVRKGHGIDINSAIVKYCHTRDSCTFQELESFMKDTFGELRLSVLVEAGNAAMVRVSQDKFVSDDSVEFNVPMIDGALNDMIRGDAVGMKEITSLGLLPYCGYEWNLYLLESYCRRFSRDFRYEAWTPNSQNSGAIIRKECSLPYHTLMAKSVANSGIPLEETEVYNHLIMTGYLSRRRYGNIRGLIQLAADLREGGE